MSTVSPESGAHFYDNPLRRAVAPAAPVEPGCNVWLFLEGGHTHSCDGNHDRGPRFHWCGECRRWWGLVPSGRDLVYVAPGGAR